MTLDAERARRRADEADAALARGESWGPLHGLPISVKDCFETQDLRTTAGSPSLAEHVPDARRRRGRSGCGPPARSSSRRPTRRALAMDWQTYNPLFGTTCNPWDASRTPGGSSGGSAAAIAAGLSGLELGSDIGGSIRIPASWCGIFGHKPSWGIVPERGHIPGWPGALREDDINVVGPLARSAADLALALGVLAGPLPGSRARLEARAAARRATPRCASTASPPGSTIRPAPSTRRCASGSRRPSRRCAAPAWRSTRRPVRASGSSRPSRSTAA